MRRAWWLAVGLWACFGGASEPAVPVSEVAPAAPEPAPFMVVERVLGGPDDASAALPWIVAMHGMGDRADRFVRAFDGWDGPPVRVLSVQAPEPLGSGFTWFPLRVGDSTPSELSPVVIAQADAVAAAIPTWAEQYQVHGAPVVTGFSQGGMLSFAIGVRHPDAIAGAVPVSGWLVDGLVAPHPPHGDTAPVRAVHGVDDEILAYVPTRRGVARLRASGFDVRIQGFAGVGHSIPPEMRRVWWSLLVDLLDGEASDPPPSPGVAPGAPAR